LRSPECRERGEQLYRRLTRQGRAGNLSISETTLPARSNSVIFMACALGTSVLPLGRRYGVPLCWTDPSQTCLPSGANSVTLLAACTDRITWSLGRISATLKPNCGLNGML